MKKRLSLLIIVIVLFCLIVMFAGASHESDKTNKFVNSHGVVWTEVQDVQKELNLMTHADYNLDRNSIKYYTVVLIDNIEYTIVAAEYESDFFEMSKDQLIEDTKKYLKPRR